MPYPVISTVLKWDDLNVKSEQIIWTVITNWIEVDRATRLQHLPSLIKECLRFGRLPASFIRMSIFESTPFLAIPSDSQEDVNQFVANVFSSNETITDGHGLLYNKSIPYFCPRKTRHLILATKYTLDDDVVIQFYDYQLNKWFETQIKLPASMHSFGMQILDGMLYAFGRMHPTTSSSNVMYALNLSQSSPKWVSKCPMNETHICMASVILDGQLYVLGGSTRKCERYNPSLDKWTEIADLNIARYDASAVAHNGRIYIGGGFHEPSVEVYYPEANHWQLIKPMINPRGNFALACYDNRIWAIGGYVLNTVSRHGLPLVESYDLESQDGQWRQEQPLVHGRSFPKAINLNGDLYVIGGCNGNLIIILYSITIK